MCLLIHQVYKNCRISGQGDIIVINQLITNLSPCSPLWSPTHWEIIDLHVCDTDAQSYLNHTPTSVLLKAEAEKKLKFSSAATAWWVHFTLLCFFVDGLAGPQASSFLHRLAAGLALHWERHYLEVIYWIRAALVFALLRATGLGTFRYQDQMALLGLWRWCH